MPRTFYNIKVIGLGDRFLFFKFCALCLRCFCFHNCSDNVLLTMKRCLDWKGDRWPPGSGRHEC